MKAKRILLVGLVLALSLCLTGCKGNEDLNNNVPSGDDNNQVVSGNVENSISASVNDVMTALMSKGTIMVNAPMQDVIPADQATTFIGLSQEDFETNVSDSVFYESMMSPANQSYCLVKVKENADVAALKQTIFDNCNPRKWICMAAERVVVIDSGSYILLAMGPTDSCDAIVTEFKDYFNGNTGEMLDRMFEENIEMEPDMLAE